MTMIAHNFNPPAPVPEDSRGWKLEGSAVVELSRDTVLRISPADLRAACKCEYIRPADWLLPWTSAGGRPPRRGGGGGGAQSHRRAGGMIGV